MARLLTYMYLAVAVYCLVNAFMTIFAHHPQLTWLFLLLTAINFGFFAMFRKQPRRVKQVKLKLLEETEQ